MLSDDARGLRFFLSYKNNSSAVFGSLLTRRGSRNKVQNRATFWHLHAWFVLLVPRAFFLRPSSVLVVVPFLFLDHGDGPQGITSENVCRIDPYRCNESVCA